jgi:replicative DNA helicase Mcm
MEKLAVGLQLFGGSEVRLPDGTRCRGDIHILLLGDPSTGKSKLLSAVREIAPRAVVAEGGGSSAVGLTGSVRKEGPDGMWVLEAGALVLAHRGHALIDEFDKTDEEDRGKLHGAMEGGKVAINKAGINAELNCACSILAAANPKKGRVGQDVPLEDLVDLPLPLIHRFDAIFIIVDEPGNKEKDAQVADHMLRGHAAAVRAEAEGRSLSTEEVGSLKPSIPPGLLRKYIHYARTQQRPPTMSDEAVARARDYFLELRGQSTNDGPTLISRRQLDGLVRFAEASARARLSLEVSVDDIERSRSIYEYWARRLAPEGRQWDMSRLYGGLSQTLKDDLARLKDLVRVCDRGAGAVKTEVLDRAERDLGMKPDRVRYLVEKLHTEGGIFERDDDHWRAA